MYGLFIVPVLKLPIHDHHICLGQKKSGGKMFKDKSKSANFTFSS